MTADLAMLIDLSVRGHWGADPRCHLFCGHPTPPEAPQARMESDAFARFEALAELFAQGPLEACLMDEYVPLHKVAYPALAGQWVPKPRRPA